MLTYRLVGVKDESSKGKNHFEDRKMDEIDLFNSRLPPFGGDHVDKPPTLSKILSADTPQGKAYLQERLDSSGSETWRQFFFSTLERTATRLDIYEDAKNARDDMMMRSMCVKTIMRAPEPMMFPLDTLSLSISPSEERRGKVKTAAAKCRKVLSLKGDVSLCPLFTGTRADVYEELRNDQHIQVDSDIVEVRRPFAFEVSVGGRKKIKKPRRHPGRMCVILSLVVTRIFNPLNSNTCTGGTEDIDNDYQHFVDPYTGSSQGHEQRIVVMSTVRGNPSSRTSQTRIPSVRTRSSNFSVRIILMILEVV